MKRIMGIEWLADGSIEVTEQVSGVERENVYAVGSQWPVDTHYVTAVETRRRIITDPERIKAYVAQAQMEGWA